jgi:beta-phosphoglucomutase-like phosphatase (HAD superfamily)
MSFSDEAARVISALGLDGSVDTVVGVDHVQNPKPAPDAFVLAMDRLEVSPEQTLIVEDSPAGARAAAASGARWLCVATAFSRQALENATDLDQRWIVKDPARLDEFVAARTGQPA